MHRSTPFAEEDIVIVDGIPCTNIARTLCDLGAVVPDGERSSWRWMMCSVARRERTVDPRNTRLESIVPDRAVPMRFDACSPGPDRAGALPRLQIRAARRTSPLERRSSRAGPPMADTRTAGSRRARLDLAWPDVKLAVEPSGDRFHTGTRRGRRERARARVG